MKKIFLIILILFSISSFTFAQVTKAEEPENIKYLKTKESNNQFTLYGNTKSNEIECDEGVLACQDIKYTETNKKTGEEKILKGGAKHRYNEKGASGHFLGYSFWNKDNYEYYILEDQKLFIILKDNKEISREEYVELK